MFADLAIEYGWTFAEIADMTLDQIYIARSHGKTPSGKIPVRDPSDVAQVRRNWRKYIE